MVTHVTLIVRGDVIHINGVHEVFLHTKSGKFISNMVMAARALNDMFFGNVHRCDVEKTSFDLRKRLNIYFEE